MSLSYFSCTRITSFRNSPDLAFLAFGFRTFQGCFYFSISNLTKKRFEILSAQFQLSPDTLRHENIIYLICILPVWRNQRHFTYLYSFTMCPHYLHFFLFCKTHYSLRYRYSSDASFLFTFCAYTHLHIRF